MAIISTFFKTRTEARNAKVDFGGKIVDNGSNSEAGKRWELQYEIATKSEAVKELAEVLMNDNRPTLDDVLGTTGFSFDDAPIIKMDASGLPKRDIMTLPKGVKSQKGRRKIMMRDRKKHAVIVTHKRRFNLEA